MHNVFQEPIQSENAVIAFGVKALIMKDHEFLVLKRKNRTLDLPGGRIESNESFMDCLYREVFEETNILDIEIVRPIHNWSFLKNPRLFIYGLTFLCRYVSGTVRLSNEHQKFFWQDTENMDQLFFYPAFLGKASNKY